jgi:hypothetical protein
MSDLNNSAANLDALRAAVAKARTFVNEDPDEFYDWTGLFATRQDFGDGEFAWHVTFGSGDFMTRISDTDMRDMSDDELAEQIWSCWDSDWDDVLVENPAGDFTVGSSDFRQRDSEYWDESRES